MAWGRRSALAAALLAACGGVTNLEEPSAEAGADADADAGEDSSVEASDGSTAADATATDVIDAPSDSGPGIIVPFDAGAICPAPPADSVLPPALAAAGTRLVPRTLAEKGPAAGLDLPHDIYDTVLGAKCTPAPYSDGKIRCVPEMQLAGAKLYADAARTQPVVIAPLANPNTGALVGVVSIGASPPYGPFGCGQQNVALFGRVGAQLPTSQYYEAAGSVPRTVSSGYGVFEINPEAADFPELVEVRTRFGGAVAVRELHGADGSRLFANDFYDTAHDVPVRIDANGRLMPPRVEKAIVHGAPPVGGVVTSAWCQAPDAFFGFPTCGPTPAFITAPSGSTYSVQAQTRTFYSCSGGATLEGIPQPLTLQQRTSTLLAPCASVAIADWTAVSSLTVGGGRLRADAYSIAGNTYLPPGKAMDSQLPSREYLDTTLGKSCRAAVAADDSWRCFPMLLSATVGYADPACTIRVARYNGAGTPMYALEGSLPPLSFPSYPRGAVSAFAVGAPRISAPIYRRTETGCGLVGSAASFEIVGTVSPDVFAELEIRNVPP